MPKVDTYNQPQLFHEVYGTTKRSSLRSRLVRQVRPILDTPPHNPNCRRNQKTQLNVYERPLVLVDADGHTREFYDAKGVHLGEPILPPPVSAPVVEPPLLPPSVDSFTGGDDDDELASRSTSLIPSPPRKIRGEDVMFRYTAELK